ncbi:MAG: hypothetical protein ACLGSH_08925 [Acidobacteriota bacterium]
MRRGLAERFVVGVLAVLLGVPALPAAAAPRQQGAQQPQATSSGAQGQQTPAQQDAAQSSSQAGAPAAPAVGTAAAPYEKASGMTASRPAGAVIAPAKQHRVRRIFIRLGIVVGAAAAVGTVAALSHASPSQPH